MGCAASNSAKSIPITVTGSGIDFNKAKDNAFLKAIEQEIGVIILSTRESRNFDLVKNEIVTHSAGYVDNFKVKDTQFINNQYHVTVDVWVKTSKIAERVLGKLSDTAAVPGEQLSNQYKTYMNDRATGDSLLNTVLSDYSSKAYLVEKGKSQFMLDKQRNALYVTEFKLRWNYNYLTALNEVLSLTEDPSSRSINQDRIIVQSKDPAAFLLGSTNRYTFNDGVRGRIIKNKLRGTVTIMATLYDVNRKRLMTTCSYPIHMLPEHMVDPLIIRGNEVVRGEIIVKINPNNPAFRKLHEVTEVELTYTTGRCYNFD